VDNLRFDNGQDGQRPTSLAPLLLIRGNRGELAHVRDAARGHTSTVCTGGPACVRPVDDGVTPLESKTGMEFANPPVDFDLRCATPEDVLRLRDRIVAEAAVLMERSSVPKAVEILRQLEFVTVDEQTLELTDPFLDAIAGDRNIVATLDAHRMPDGDEVVIVYGNYPHLFGNIVVNNPIKRHVADFWRFRHDVIEYDRRWDGVDQIFIINADDRRDRYDAVLRELANARAPLSRITRVRAFKEDLGEANQLAADMNSPAVLGAIGCLRSHIEALRKAGTAQCDHVLVLEDDFCFSSDLDMHLTDLSTFVARAYEYWVCLIATSKYGAIVPKDDLVSVSFQPCTNTAGYLVSRQGVSQVLSVFEESLERLRATGLTTVYAADRCWSVLQPSGHFLLFRRKFGFQGSSFSDIERSISRYLD